jgi:hypothetical protein
MQEHDIGSDPNWRVQYGKGIYIEITTYIYIDISASGSGNAPCHGRSQAGRSQVGLRRVTTSAPQIQTILVRRTRGTSGELTRVVHLLKDPGNIKA